MKEQDDLEHFRKLADACIDYDMSVPLFQIKTKDFDSEEYYDRLKNEIERLYQQGSVRRLKQFCKDLIEPYRDNSDASFNIFIIEKMGIDLGIRGVDRKNKVPSEEWIDLIISYDKISSQDDYDKAYSAATNPYLKISDDKLRKLESLLLQYEYYELRDEHGERLTEISRRNKSKRRRNFEHYTIMFKMSPDKMNVATIDEGHQKDGNNKTSISIDRGLSGGTIFYANGIDLGISMDWENNKKLVVYLPENVDDTIKNSQFFSRGIYIDIVYHEH